MSAGGRLEVALRALGDPVSAASMAAGVVVPGARSRRHVFVRKRTLEESQRDVGEYTEITILAMNSPRTATLVVVALCVVAVYVCLYTVIAVCCRPIRHHHHDAADHSGVGLEGGVGDGVRHVDAVGAPDGVRVVRN